MKLYGYWRSSCTWRVRIVLAHKNVAFTYEPIHLAKGVQHQAPYVNVNPARTVPLLEWTEGGELMRLSQSLAIIEYLEAKFPTPSIFPSHPYLAARARMIAELINSGIQPLQNLSVLQRLKNELKQDDKAWAQHWIARGLGQLETLVQQTAGNHCVGDTPSVADACLVPQLYNARRFGIDLGPYPTLTRIDAACAELPAFQAAHADRQPDAEK